MIGVHSESAYLKAIPITKPKTKIVAIVSALNRWSASQPGT